MSEFTPGKWHRFDMEFYAEIRDGQDSNIAMVARADDANLIAAAPEMYEALMEIIKVWNDKNLSWAVTEMVLREIMPNAEAALAKANGEVLE